MSGAPPELAAADAIRGQWPHRPRVGLVLGSGLGELARRMHVEASLDYANIPHFPLATAPGHRGRWMCGTLGGASVVAMDGRLHAYEGHSAEQIAFPLRVMKALGVETVILTNACGGMNPQYRAGDIVVIDDHINLTWGNPLVRPHKADSLSRCPDMSRPYDAQLVAGALATARRHNFAAHRGVYVGVTGPNYETRAEYRFLRRIGGDAVGMSTVHEVIVAVQCGMRVLGLSVVTNVCSPDVPQPTDAEQVMAVAAAAEPNVATIVLEAVERFGA